ncbi:hypothetical protein SEF58_09305 [Neomoorella humiferrea]|uniref:hypothetical protein n=1 Tax=Neomoorella humiferrea TaxID=676965 RepID=UPI003D93BB3E
MDGAKNELLFGANYERKAAVNSHPVGKREQKFVKYERKKNVFAGVHRKNLEESRKIAIRVE